MVSNGVKIVIGAGFLLAFLLAGGGKFTRDNLDKLQSELSSLSGSASEKIKSVRERSKGDKA